ncbi:MAG: patatin-like phospholipase family protein [Acidimicrobiales bacterium]|nr:patatin-like phospholipase family protein [Acidimicrobiales bacterium]
MSDALVLSGGGTKGAFEVGALRHVIDDRGFVPSIITATSAGALIGVKLAEARGPDELRSRLDELERDLLAMTDRDVVFAPQPWLAELEGTPVGDAVERLLSPPKPVPGEPPRRRARHLFGELVQALGSLPSVSRAGTKLRTAPSSILTLDPLEDQLRGGRPELGPVDPALVGRPGLQLRLAVTCIDDGATRYVTERGGLVERDATTPAVGAEGGVDLVDGVLSSASVPMVFPPRRLAGGVYTDGGSRQLVPVEAALLLGATRIVTVLAVPYVQPVAGRDWTSANLLEIHLRAGLIQLSEIQRSNVASPLPAGAEHTVVDPTLDVVDAFEVNPGLMRIDLDYGWLRAGECLADLTDTDRARARSLTDAAVDARVRAWFLEEGSRFRGRADLDALRAVKDEVAEALRERAGLGLPLPDGAAHSWLGYEQHAEPPPEPMPPSPWFGAEGEAPRPIAS